MGDREKVMYARGVTGSNGHARSFEAGWQTTRRPWDISASKPHSQVRRPRSGQALEG
jgi:hypothetical protein